MGALPRRASGRLPRALFSAVWAIADPRAASAFSTAALTEVERSPGVNLPGGEAASHLAQRPVSLLLALPTERKPLSLRRTMPMIMAGSACARRSHTSWYPWAGRYCSYPLSFYFSARLASLNRPRITNGRCSS